MLNLKVRDVPLRGCGFTLFKAAEEYGVQSDSIRLLAYSIYPKYDECEPSYDLPIPSEVSTKVFDTAYLDNTLQQNLQILESAGLITTNGELAKLTEKAENIFNRASEIKKKLDTEGFSYCPCHFG